MNLHEIQPKHEALLAEMHRRYTTYLFEVRGDYIWLKWKNQENDWRQNETVKYWYEELGEHLR